MLWKEAEMLSFGHHSKPPIPAWAIASGRCSISCRDRSRIGTKIRETKCANPLIGMISKLKKNECLGKGTNRLLLIDAMMRQLDATGWIHPPRQARRVLFLDAWTTLAELEVRAGCFRQEISRLRLGPQQRKLALAFECGSLSPCPISGYTIPARMPNPVSTPKLKPPVYIKFWFPNSRICHRSTYTNRTSLQSPFKRTRNA